MKPLWQRDPRVLPFPLGALGSKELHLWLPAWLVDRAERTLARFTQRIDAPPYSDPTPHLFFAVCDHYEPLHGGVNRARGHARVQRWHEQYPVVTRDFRDDDGRPPRHSFFYPGEQYAPEYLEPLTDLTRRGFGEVEVHLHHDGDTRETLRSALEKTLSDLGQHGLVAEGAHGPMWGFIHGNWCLANGRRDGRFCGVDDEMDLLYELGCYADYTFPSAPDPCQPSMVNVHYYPSGDVRKRRAYEQGDPVVVGMPKRNRLMLVTGPLALSRKKGGLRIESSALDAHDPPTEGRLRTWLSQNVHVLGRPSWTFVKVHTHGAPEDNAAMLLGEPMRRFHELLRSETRVRGIALHYVTSREMYNLIRAAMDNQHGPPAEFFDYEVPPPPCRG